MRGLVVDPDRYDRAIIGLYAAGRGIASLGTMFEAIARAVDADAAGVSIYDEADSVITHTLTWLPRGAAVPPAEHIRALNADAGARLVTGTRLREPRRFSDIVPADRLRQARWFRTQREITGLGHGMVADVVAANVRLRPFAMRDAGRADFAPGEVEVLGRLAVHFGHAFKDDVAGSPRMTCRMTSACWSTTRTGSPPRSASIASRRPGRRPLRSHRGGSRA